VILGAGLDTSAYRGVALSGVNVFEAAHPGAHAWKLPRLQTAQIPIPASVHFVPVNFEIQSLAKELQAFGFRTDLPAFFSWLGVVPYRTRVAATRTFSHLGKLPEGNGAVFDYSASRFLSVFWNGWPSIHYPDASRVQARLSVCSSRRKN
jgi:methyltransferase (TIGR00027 family)